MTDETKVEVNESENAQSGGKQDDIRMFTQAELDAVVTDRLARERKKATEKYADYEALKEKASRLDEIEKAQLSELEQAQQRAAEADARAEQALRSANERLILAEVVAEASKLGALNPRDAYRLLEEGDVKVEDGKVVGAESAVKSLVDAGRLVMRRPSAPDLDAGKGSGEREKEKKPESTADQEEMARKLGVSIEEYMKRVKKKR
jgi:multidrug efflux pump subunit AcrA (membrane-fusion protein)